MPKPKTSRTQPLTAMVEGATRRTLDRIAREERRSVSQLVRIALDEFIARRKNAA